MSAKKVHQRLLAWYQNEKRDLPWRKNRDPYRVWISEIMLQQTRVEAVIPYYERFLSHFPTVKDLAEAPQEKVTNLWAGLGYYSRARNLHSAAQQVMSAFQGEFPASLEALQTLKGIGSYTARAIGSIAFHHNVAAIDGNLERVISRLIALEKNPKKEGKAAIEAFGGGVTALGNAGDLNQAFMDLSSRICLPKNPRCLECPLEGICESKKKSLTDRIPLKVAKVQKIELKAQGVLLLREKHIFIAKRPPGSWLQGMWDLPWWLETEPGIEMPKGARPFGEASTNRAITKHKIEFSVKGYRWDQKSNPPLKKIASEGKWVALEDLHGIHLPRPSEKLLEKLLDQKEA